MHTKCPDAYSLRKATGKLSEVFFMLLVVFSLTISSQMWKKDKQTNKKITEKWNITLQPGNPTSDR